MWANPVRVLFQDAIEIFRMAAVVGEGLVWSSSALRFGPGQQ